MQSRKCWTKFRFINSLSIFGTFKFTKLFTFNKDVRYTYVQDVSKKFTVGKFAEVERAH